MHPGAVHWALWAVCSTYFPCLSLMVLSLQIGLFNAAFLVVTALDLDSNNLTDLQRSRWTAEAAAARGTLDIGYAPEPCGHPSTSRAVYKLIHTACVALRRPESICQNPLLCRSGHLADPGTDIFFKRKRTATLP